jgi:glycosyltransferase involved in cell wall biosynthesis
MHRGLKISVVIRATTKRTGVRYTMGQLPACVDEVVVVDNNSTDRTAEVARSLGARVVRETRKGYGRVSGRLPAATGDVTA